jgi:hypothetical protein
LVPTEKSEEVGAAGEEMLTLFDVFLIFNSKKRVLAVRLTVTLRIMNYSRRSSLVITGTAHLPGTSIKKVLFRSQRV